MKTSFVYILYCMAICSISAQDISFLSDTPQWLYAHYYNDMLRTVEPVAQIDDQSSGFEELNGWKYHLLYQVDRLDTNGEVIFALFEPLRVREDNGRVYVLYEDFKKQIDRLCKHEMYIVPIPYQQTSEDELLLYDFTLQPGDKYPTSPSNGDVYVEQMESIISDDGRNRKLFTLSNGLKILEGVGCLNSRNGTLLYYLYPPEVWKHDNDLYYDRLHEYRKNGIVVYKDHSLPTGLNHMLQQDNITRNVVYDLTGRRLTREPEKGMYIKDGRKYLKR